jgi:hypothetical protein
MQFNLFNQSLDPVDQLTTTPPGVSSVVAGSIMCFILLAGKLCCDCIASGTWPTEKLTLDWNVAVTMGLLAPS